MNKSFYLSKTTSFKYFKIYFYLVLSIITTLSSWHYTFNHKASAQDANDFYLSYDSKGVISVPINKEPVSYLYMTQAYDDAKVKVEIYKAKKEDLLNYIVYDNDGDRKNKFLNKKDLEPFSNLETSLNGDTLNRVSLPIKDTGIYYLEFTSERGVKESAIYIISKYGTIATSGEDKLILWTQNFETGKKVTEGKLTFYNLKNEVDKLDQEEPNDDGVIETDYNINYDIALFENEDDISFIKINRSFLSYEFDKNDFPTYFNKFSNDLQAFGFTERPIYKPGDKLFFKGIFRNDYNAKLSITNAPINVKIYQYNSSPIFDKNFQTNEYGSIDGEFNLPEDIATGYYTIEFTKLGNYSGDYERNLNSYSSYFQVEYFRKPSYFIETSTKKDQVIAGDKHSFEIKATYFSGNPVSGQKVKYKIINTNYYNFTYLNDRNLYPFKSSETNLVFQGDTIKEGEVNLDENGTAQVEYDANFSAEGNQIIQFEAEINDGSGNPAVSTSRILAYRGEFDIYRNDDYQSSVKVNNSVNIPVKLKENLVKNSLDNKELSVEIKRTWWEEDKNSDNPQFPTMNLKEEFITNLYIKTNSNGESNINFIPQATGTYNLKLQGKDSRGNNITNTLYLYVTEDSSITYYSDYKSYFTVNTDKDLYNINDIARLKINSESPNIDLFVAYQRNKVLKYEVVSLNGKSTEINLPIDSEYAPNVFVDVIGYSNGFFRNTSKNIKVNMNYKKLDIKVTPDRNSYGPSDQVSLDINVKDLNGVPAQTEIALWLVDKAIYELTGAQSYDVFSKFWYERSNSTYFITSLDPLSDPGGGGGGCFAEGTKILMNDKSLKNIEDIKVGDLVLTKENQYSNKLVASKVTKTFKHNVSGYLIINNNLRVTPEHKIYVSGEWKEIGSASVGDKLLDNYGNEVEIKSIEWIKGNFNVYNFTVENQHTYFAENIYVHNDKGASARVDFRDTAYWNPSLKTDINGNAKVTFKLPDNLTTWVILSVGNTLSSQFGDSQTEIKVSKDIVISPILPNILRESDEINAAALIQNFTDQEQSFDVSLNVENAGTLQSPEKISVTLKPKEIKVVDFKLNTGAPTENAKFTYKLQSKTNPDNSDEVVLSIPIREYGFYSYRSESAEGNKNFQLKFSDQINLDKSSLKVALAPSILGKLPASFDYLLEYPFGCVEQTSSKLVPALVIKKYPQLYSQISSNYDTDSIIDKSIKRLNKLAVYDGWDFWNPREINYFVTANVIENLLDAKKLGYKIDESQILNSFETMKNVANSSYTESNPNDIAFANYALALTGNYESIYKIELDKLNQLTIDALAMHVMALYMSGETNPDLNGLRYLESKAILLGDVAYFESGLDENFGSIDASTALAVRAIVLAKGNYELALKATKYLTNSKGNNYYWSNTYGTAQVIRAISEFAVLSKESNPNYSYELKLDGNQILNGKVDNNFSIIPNKIFKSSDIKGGTNLEIVKNGEGQLYSNIIYKEFINDRKYKSSSNGLSITREYVNTKGDIYNLGVGDIVDVTFKIKGNNSNNLYAVLVDELPAGLVPVNQSLENETFNREETQVMPNPFVGNISEYEYTENGVVLTINDITNFERTYTYKARVVSEGNFIAPPAFISLMYNPNIKANTSTEYVKTYQETNTNYLKIVINFFTKYIILILQVLLFLGLFVSLPIYLALRYLSKKKELTIKELLNNYINKLKSLFESIKNNILNFIKKVKKK